MKHQIVSVVMMGLVLISTSAMAVSTTSTKSSGGSNTQHVNLLVSPGIGFYPYPGSEVRAGVMINPYNQIEAGYSAAFSNSGATSRYSHRTTDLTLRHFLMGGSFAVFGGVASREITTNFDTSRGESIDGADFSGLGNTIGKVRSTGAQFGIGNLWHAGPVALGCDWIGGYSPLQHEKTARLSTSGVALTDEQKQRANRLALAQDTAVTHFLKLMVGVAF